MTNEKIAVYNKKTFEKKRELKPNMFVTYNIEFDSRLENTKIEEVIKILDMNIFDKYSIPVYAYRADISNSEPQNPKTKYSTSIIGRMKKFEIGKDNELLGTVEVFGVVADIITSMEDMVLMPICKVNDGKVCVFKIVLISHTRIKEIEQYRANKNK